MTIIGIDPGTARIGWSVLSMERGTPHAKAYGLITTPKEGTAESRLAQLYDAMNVVLEKYEPDVMSIEALFFTKNVTTAIAVGQARGILLLAAAKRGIPVASYTPSAVKLAVCGDGRADKTAVQAMVVRTLRLKETPKPDDVADAIAIGLTHAFSHRTGRSMA